MDMSVALFYVEANCHCKKSKFLDEQCPNKRKSGEFFCGVHMKSVKKFIFEPIVTHGILLKDGGIPIKKEENIGVIGNMDIFEGDGEGNYKSRGIYGNKNLFFYDLFVKKVNMSVYSIRHSIQNVGLVKVVGGKKQSRKELIEKLYGIYRIEEYYMKNIEKVIKVQSYIRKIQTKEYYLKKCKNDTDMMSFDSIYSIPREYLYIFCDRFQTKGSYCYYAYDIRSLVNILKMKNPSCPYTCRELNELEIYLIVNQIVKCKEKGIMIEMEKPEMTQEEEVDMLMRDVFHEINLLGNYTSFEWFRDLSKILLLEFYRIAEDIWNYRLQMSLNDKKRYIKNGIAFTVSKTELKDMSKIEIQKVCLNEIRSYLGINCTCLCKC